MASAETFVISRCSCCGPHHRSSPLLRTGWKLPSVEFRKLSSTFPPFSRQSSYHLLLKRLPSKRISSVLEEPTSNSEDPKRADQYVDTKSSSPESQRAPDVPGIITQRDVSGKYAAHAQSAFERAVAYKKLKNSGIAQSSPSPSPAASKDIPQVEIIRGQQVGSMSRRPSSDSSVSSSILDGDSSTVCRASESQAVDVETVNSEGVTTFSSSLTKGKGETVSIAAFDRAKAYKQKQAEMVAALRGNSDESKGGAGKSGPTASADAEEKVVEIEIITRDGVIKRKLMNPEEQRRAFSNIKDVKRRGVSGMDFAGLGFADKKKFGRPAGLSDDFVAPPTGTLPEVEILTRDAGTEYSERDQSSDLYKPRVSTWGVFPRPANISKTYGGGRTIRPGESLETEEEKKEREARTQQLLVDYRKKLGLDVDLKIKAEGEQAMKQGDSLMDNGYLREALQMYELVMRKMPAQSELYGVAALQAAVCLDSLSRYDEARKVYEKLLGHPNGGVSKQARRFLFGFQAMEELKVGGGGYKWDTTMYQKYFDSFATDGYNTAYKAGEEETASTNLTPYVLLLLFPILLVLAIAVVKP